MSKLLPILFALLIATSAWAESGVTRHLYRVFYRIGSTTEWREAVEAGSPVDSEEKAIELGKLVKEKFDHGGLAAFEIEVRKFKVVTRPATKEEDRELAAGGGTGTTVVGLKKIGSSVIITTPARQEPTPHASTQSSGHRGPSSSHDGAGNGPERTTSVQYPQDDSAKLGETESGATRPVAEGSGGAAVGSGQLMMDESVPRTKIQTVTRVVIDAGASGQVGESTTQPAASGKVGTLDDLVARLQRESQMRKTGIQPVVALVPAAGPATSLDPDFFRPQANVQSRSQPVAARRIRVIRNGQVIARTDYDASGTRIESPVAETTAVGEAQPMDPAAGESGSRRPEAELVFDENAPRGGQTAEAKSADKEQAAALQRDREMLTKLQAEMDTKKGEIDQETKRLEKERGELDREKESFRTRGQELSRRESALNRPSLQGRSGSGSMWGGNEPLSIQFGTAGKLTLTDSEKTCGGTWSQSGNSITMSANDSTFVGTVNGDSISGNRSRTDGLRDTWSVTLNGSPASSPAGRQDSVRDRRQLESDQVAHDARQKAHQQSNEQVRSSRLRLQAEQGRYEDAFARHRQQTLDFNSRPRQ